ncbi:MAG: RNA pyrophosphohydrolase [Gammaproteobacteria bacterium]|nr:RNA pyrophosphohydrolase [Gammaproteobacteria bacterium]
MIDEQGYRPNVGIILCNVASQVFWARRRGRDGWQFPQGGIKSHETAEQALYRELYEEVGLGEEHVALLGRTRDWLYYDIPDDYLRRTCQHRPFRGQKQIWFLLRFVASENDVCLDRGIEKPEFDSWCWVDYWSTLDHIIDFKRDVYRRALAELEPLLKIA